MMGDKIEARKTAIANNVPVIPGTESPVRTYEEVSTELHLSVLYLGILVIFCLKALFQQINSSWKMSVQDNEDKSHALVVISLLLT